MLMFKNTKKRKIETEIKEETILARKSVAPKDNSKLVKTLQYCSVVLTIHVYKQHHTSNCLNYTYN